MIYYIHDLPINKFFLMEGMTDFFEELFGKRSIRID